MSAVPRDRIEWAIGSFVANDEDGPVYAVEAISYDVMREAAKLVQCGDKVAAGELLIRTILADERLQEAAKVGQEKAKDQDQRDMFESANSDSEGNYFPSWERFTSRDAETGITCRGEI